MEMIWHSAHRHNSAMIDHLVALRHPESRGGQSRHIKWEVASVYGVTLCAHDMDIFLCRLFVGGSDMC